MPPRPFRSETTNWPYERSPETDVLDSTRSAQKLYVEALEQMLLTRPCVRCRYSAYSGRNRPVIPEETGH